MRPRPARLAVALFAFAAVLLATNARRAEARPVPHMDHIIVVIMENKDYNTALAGTYTRTQLVTHESSFSSSFAITHPSQPNYLGLWAGSTVGVTNDACPPPGAPYSNENLGHACEAAGLTWRAYSENLPSVGYTGCTFTGTLYTRKHDPWVNFNNLNHVNERPYSDLQLDINAGTLPNLAFVIPNNCDNSHDNGCNYQVGDNWLAANLPKMRNAVGPKGLVILTWDEDSGGSGNHILTVFAADSVKRGYVSGTHITHYTVLRTTCDALGIAPFGAAATENAIADVWLEPRTITASAGPNGSISPSGSVAVILGADQGFTVTPDVHYHVADVLVDGASVGAVTSYAFTRVTMDHTIEASFAIDTRAILASAGPNGSISPSGSVTVNYGADQSLAITPDLHYHVGDVLVDGASVGAVTSYTFTRVAMDHTIEASFAIDTQTLSVVVRGSGTVARAPSLERYDYGSTVQLTASPEPGWVFSGWSGDASGVETTLTLLMDGDKTVTATFALQIAFDFKPHALHLNSKGKWVTGYLRPPAPFVASQIDVPSIRLNGTVPVAAEVPAKVEEHDTRLKVKFMRSEVRPTLAAGDSVPVTVTGMIAGQAMLGTDTIKVKAPRILAPIAGAQLVAGTTVPVIWEAPEGTTSVTLLSSFDDGITWNVEAEDIANAGTFTWMVPAVNTALARLEIMAVYGVDETGVIPESEFAASDAFSIQTVAGVDGGQPMFALRRPNPVTGPLTVSYSLAGESAAILAVYDVSGRLVVSRHVASSPGWHATTLGDLPSGVYLVRLSEGERRLSYRVAVMR